MNENNTASPLFPTLEPFATHMLEVGDGHTLYVEQSGNPDGLPVVVLHGGPGSGCSPKSRQRFDPALYHIICFDQRGCGRSLPLGRLEANTTAHLVADIERIRALIGAENWVVYGTSWGCTLALVYAQAHPVRVKGLLLGGVFLGSAKEIAWLSAPNGLAQFRPQEYAAILELLGHPSEPLEHALYRVVTHADTTRARAAAEAFALYEASACFPEAPREQLLAYFREDPGFMAHISLELHYMAQGLFLETPLLEGCAKLKGIPVTILQGAIDFVCPPATAYALHKALPGSELVIVPTSNHVANDAMEAARVEATTYMAKRLGY